MAKKSKQKNPFEGRWRINWMDQWDQDYVDEEVEGYIEFEPRGNCVMEDSKPQVNHDSIVDDWQRNAKAHDDENYEFLRSMKIRDYGFEPDELAGHLHEEAFQIVDCTRCTNCCKTMDIKFDEQDVERIAGHLDMNSDTFIQTYLEPDNEDGPYKVREKPCSFLGEDGRCNIYDVRPSVCREYPHTDKDGFTFRTMGVANNALVCPAVFWIVEEMKKRGGYARRSGKRRQR